MNCLKKIIIAVIGIALNAACAKADNNVSKTEPETKFEAKFVKDGLQYEVIDATSVKVEKINDKKKPKGKLKIPSTVKHNGTTYAVTTIDSWGFFGCEEVTEVEIPKSVTKVDIWAFTNCKGIKRIKFPESVKTIGYAALESCTRLEQVELPSGLTLIDERLFSECESLKNITLPAGITEIKGSAFSHCKSLTSIAIPNGVKSIGNYAFNNCTELMQVQLPASLTTIGEKAFLDCKKMENFDLPEGLTTLGESAFHGCELLKSIKLPASLTTIEGNPFVYCKQLNEIVIDPKNTSLVMRDGIMFSADMTQIFVCLTTSGRTEYEVPATVKIIGDFAFAYCNLKKIKMSAVEIISEAAFLGCDFDQIDLGKKLKEIHKQAFYSCNELTSLYLPDPLERFDINNFDFSGNLKQVSLNEKLANNKEEFNNTRFDFCSEDLIFTVRMAGGKTRTIKYNELYDKKAEYPIR